MAEPTGVSDAKSKITPEELAERIKLAKEVFARKGRVKLAWLAGAHALRAWPPRDPLELRRLAKARARFTLQEAAAVAPAGKPARGAKPAISAAKRETPGPMARPMSEQDVIVEKGQACGPSGTSQVFVLDLPLPLSRTFTLLGFDLGSQVISLEFHGGVVDIQLAGGSRLRAWRAPGLTRVVKG